MRLLYIDIDTLRPDHLGCYGYRRPTSPNIDGVATTGVRFDQVYTSDSPCLPSRTALTAGLFGTATGVVNHGGRRSEPYPAGRDRGRQDRRWLQTWPALLRQAGMRTTTISTFAERHSAFYWYAGYNEAINLGTDGQETAEQVYEVAADWLRRSGGQEDWFLHVHFWDPHTPYRTPGSFGADLGGPLLPDWLDESLVLRQRQATGPHSALEVSGWGATGKGPGGPVEQIRSLDDAAAVYDGYDIGVRYADEYVGRLLDLLDRMKVLDEVAILVSSDHGESLGELGIWCDHQTADLTTHRVPAVLRWPGIGPATDGGLHYQIDVAATVAELCGASIPAPWHGRSFAHDLRQGFHGPGRDHLVLSCAAWTVQRSVRFGPYLLMRTYHDGFHGYPEHLLFNVETDAAQQVDLAPGRPDLVGQATALMDGWLADVLAQAGLSDDPLSTVVDEGGGLYVRGRLADYVNRLRSTGRSSQADQLSRRTRPFGLIGS